MLLSPFMHVQQQRVFHRRLKASAWRDKVTYILQAVRHGWPFLVPIRGADDDNAHGMAMYDGLMLAQAVFFPTNGK